MANRQLTWDERKWILDTAAMLLATGRMERHKAIAEAFSLFTEVHCGVMEIEGGCMGNVHGIYNESCDPTMAPYIWMR
jgi:hypothetical protein